MQNPYKDAAYNLKARAKNGSILANSDGHIAIQDALDLLEEAGQKLQRDSIRAELSADPDAEDH